VCGVYTVAYLDILDVGGYADYDSGALDQTQFLGLTSGSVTLRVFDEFTDKNFSSDSFRILDD